MNDKILACIPMWLMCFMLACGPQGPQGPAGPAGPPGPAGAPGIGCNVSQVPNPNGLLISCGDGSQDFLASGTTVTPVQLCPGFTPSYPSVFPEYGLCINNNFYGVYSANDGFWSLLPPGTYSSDGINASCTLVIGANCTVNGQLYGY